MSSSRGYRLYAVSGRVHCYPKSYLTRVRVHIHPSQPTPYYTVRACSRHWRHAPYPEERGKEEKGQAQKPEESLASSAGDHNYPFEPSRRERMWRDRMDRFRKLVDNDPYEAIFGYSNRLLKGVQQDWQIDQQAWWQKPAAYKVDESLIGRKVEIEGDEVQHQKRKTSPESSNAGKAKVTQIHTETELEYDPISNRMVPKAGKTFSHQGQELDAIVDISSETTRPASDTLQSSDHENRASVPKQSHGLSNRNPTFTMLKEDVIEQPSFPASQGSVESPNHRMNDMDSARREYEDYKARRFGNTSPSEHWLAQEGFQDSSMPSKLSSTLNEKFDALHSQKQEAEANFTGYRLPKSKPRTSERIVHSESGKEFGAGSRHDILQYNKEVMAANMKNKRMDEQSMASNVIMNYNRQVVKTNLESQQLVKLMELKNKIQLVTSELKAVTQLATKVEQMSLAVPEPAKDVQLARIESDQALKSVTKSAAALETSLKRYMDNTASSSRPMQTSLQRMSGYDSKIKSAADSSVKTTEQVRTHDPVGYNHARESKRVQQLEKSSKTSRSFKIPSLADVFGYNKSGAGAPAQLPQTATTEASSKVLQDEVSKHKEAYQAFESFRREQRAPNNTIDNAARPKLATCEASAGKSPAEDVALVTEIRQIYEGEYGPITTGHRQSASTPVAAVKVDAPLVEPTKATPAEDVFSSQYAELPEEFPSDAARVTTPSEGVKHTDALETSDVTKAPMQDAPMSALKAPTPLKTARYMILSHDSKTMTTASFDSIPSPTETIIPLTVALTHLHSAGRFLPKLKELRKAGYVPVHADRSLLIMRQDESSPSMPQSDETVQEETLDKVPITDSSFSNKSIPRKMEPVFSGSSQKSYKAFGKAWREARDSRRIRRRRRIRKNVRFLMGGFVVAGAVIYVAGVGAEVRTGRKVVARREQSPQESE